MADLRAELKAIHTKHGKLTPELVVTEARKPSHPLHSRFEWDDKVAGEAYRKVQARDLIQSVRCVYREATETDPAEDVREWHSVRRPDGFVYEPIDAIAADPLAAAMLLRDAEREWKALHRRYAHLEEFISLVRADTEPAAS